MKRPLRAPTEWLCQCPRSAQKKIRREKNDGFTAPVFSRNAGFASVVARNPKQSKPPSTNCVCSRFTRYPHPKRRLPSLLPAEARCACVVYIASPRFAVGKNFRGPPLADPPTFYKLSEKARQVRFLRHTFRCSLACFLSLSSPRESTHCTHFDTATRVLSHGAHRVLRLHQVPRIRESVSHGLEGGAGSHGGTDLAGHAVRVRQEGGGAEEGRQKGGQEGGQEDGAAPRLHRGRICTELAHSSCPARRTPQVKKAMGRTATKPVGKVAKKPVKKLAKGARPSFSADVKTNSGPLGTAKSFFSFGNNDKADNLKSQDNWAFQVCMHPALHTQGARSSRTQRLTQARSELRMLHVRRGQTPALPVQTVPVPSPFGLKLLCTPRPAGVQHP